MIYITLGTQANDFSRCLKMVEQLIQEQIIDEEVVAQVGYTTYRPKGITCVDFVPEEDYQRYIEEARVVISHAGSGALFSGIKKGKKIIAVARLAKYGEMKNDHQLELIKKLTGDGYILDGTYDMKEAWEKLQGFQPHENDFFCEIPQQIKETLSQWGVKKKVGNQKN